MNQNISAAFAGDHRSAVAFYLGITLLLVLVGVISSLQFVWLGELRQEEESRRRVALNVAVANFVELVGQRLVAVIEEASMGVVSGTDAPTVKSYYRYEQGRLLLWADSRTWLPVNLAQALQHLGRPLMSFVEMDDTTSPALWLDPPAVWVCSQPGVCGLALLDVGGIGRTVLAPVAARVFSEFGDEIRWSVMIDHGGHSRVVAPQGAVADMFKVVEADVQLARSDEIDVVGPAGVAWRVRVNHGGSSLEDAVARSHLRNVLLSLGMLGLLMVGLALVVINARRMVSLARQHLYFAASVSHELRTPLTVIQSAADNLADGTVGADRARQYGQLISGEVRRLHGTVENVLQFSRSASLNPSGEVVSVDMVELVAEVLASCSDDLADRKVDFKPAAGLPHPSGDPGALRSALTNLIRNAAVYTTSGDWIRINVAAVKVHPSGRVVRVQIRNPISAPPDPDPERLFEPFYRGRNAHMASTSGTGIGLAVARNVARQHGGGMSVDTSMAGVITFSLILPVHAQPVHE